MFPTSFHGKLLFAGIIICVMYIILYMVFISGNSIIDDQADGDHGNPPTMGMALGAGVGSAVGFAVIMMLYRWIICPCDA